MGVPSAGSADVVDQANAASDFDLLVVGRHAGSHRLLTCLGSLARAAIGAPCPVMVVPVWETRSAGGPEPACGARPGTGTRQVRSLWWAPPCTAVHMALAPVSLGSVDEGWPEPR